MSDFKGAISLLCKVLYNLTSVSLKPEYFRIAKFNLDSFESTEAFWQVLHKLCCLGTYRGECSDDRTRCVVINLSQLGYKYPHRLSSDTVGHELLLILGWLLWKNILIKAINYHVCQSPLFWEFSNKDNNEEMKPEIHNDRTKLQSLEKELNYILYLAGKVRLNMKAIGSCLEERAQLCHKIHEASLGISGLPHLSVLEVKLIKDSSLVPHFMTEVEYCTQLLESYSKWKRKSHIFWEWMVSVLEESKKIKAKTNNGEENEEELLKMYLKVLKEYVRRAVVTECINKNLNTKSQRTACKRMICSSDDTQINKSISGIDVEIEKLEKECKRKEKELRKNLANLLANRSDVIVFKPKDKK